MLLSSARAYAKHADGIFAAAIAFFGMLALFPLILLLVSLFGVILQTSAAAPLVITQLTHFFPGSAGVVFSTINTMTAEHPAVIGIGLIGLLWSSMGVFMSMGYAFNRVWDLPSDRNLIAQYGLSAGLALSVGAIVVVSLVFSAVINLLTLLPDVFIRAGVPSVGVVIVVASNMLDMVIVAGSVAFLYRLLPKVDVQWRDVVVPAIAIAAVWEAAKLGFAWYLGAVAHVDVIYGPLAAFAGLMLWIYLSSMLLLFGAELSHEIAVHRAHRGRRPQLGSAPTDRAVR